MNTQCAVSRQSMFYKSDSSNMRTERATHRVAMAALMMVLAVGGLAMSAGRAEAQSTLPPCPSDQLLGWSWHNCFGSYTSTDGTIYVGEFSYDKYNGVGKELDAMGNVIREGYYVDGGYFGPAPPS